MSDTTQAPRFFRILIEGDCQKVIERTNVDKAALPYLLNRLLTGKPLAPEAFAYFGLVVTIEEDMDQGDDIAPPAMLLGVESWKR